MADDLDVIVAGVVAVDPVLAAGDVAAVVERIAAHRQPRRLLATAVSSDPAWAHGSTIAPVVVERLITALESLGSNRFTPPCCGSCGRAAHCVGRDGHGLRLCKACDHRRRTGECAMCGRQRTVGLRLADGGALCGTCYRRHPDRLAPCVYCHTVGIVHRRQPDGQAVCPRCYMRRVRGFEDMPGDVVAVCIDCGRRGFCIGVSTGAPRCARCYPKRQAPCVRCGRVGSVGVVWAAGVHCHRCRHQVLDSSGTCEACGEQRRIDPRNGDGRAVCSTCAGLDPLSTCVTCCIEARLWDKGRCSGCTLQHRLDGLFAAAPVGIAEQLAPLREALTTEGSDRAILSWLCRRGSGGRLLGELFDGTLAVSHDALDVIGTKGADYLRHVLVAVGVLTERDESLARLERWLTAQLAEIDHTDDRHHVDTFATWHVLRRRRQRAARTGTTTGSTTAARRTISATIELLAWLRQHERALDTITQADIDLWVANHPARRQAAGSFLRWAAARRLAPPVKITRRRYQHPGAATITAADHHAILQRLATDTSLPAWERAAGLLVALYGQPASKLARLRVDDVTINTDAVTLRLGRNQIELPPVLARLVVDLAADRRGPAHIRTPAANRWLFAGTQPGQPLSANWLAARIAAHGLPVTPLRTATLLELAAELPAAVLADLLGLSTTTAVRWTQAAGGEWATYAAVRARSTRRQP